MGTIYGWCFAESQDLMNDIVLQSPLQPTRTYVDTQVPYDT